MKMDKKFKSILLLSFLMLSVFSVIGKGRFQAVAQPPNPASLTGIIYDVGVDTDGDTYFDYLEISVEVNVAKAGEYQVYASGLANSGYIYVSDSSFASLDVGLHVVNLNFHGPTIYSSGINPVIVSYIRLSEIFSSSGWYDSIYDVALSEQYFHDDFNPPFADMEAKFTVYPDGRVVMGGALDYSPLPSPFVGVDIAGYTSFTGTGGSTEMSADFAFVVQPSMADMFVFDDSSFNMLGTYSGGMADISINGNVVFPPSLASQFPLNVSDFTVVADYSNNEITGTITAPLISGMPIVTIDIDFYGNLTDLYLSDELEIVYGNFFGYEINETMVEHLLLQYNSTLPGTEPESLYNMTKGILECTRLETTMTKRTNNATITFDAHIHGDFVQLFVFYMTSTLYGAPQVDPGLYWLVNALVSSIETGHFELSYAYMFGEASMELSFTADFAKLWADLESTLPEEIPPQQRIPIELLLNTTLCSVDAAKFSWTYENGRSDLHINATIGPDLNAELDFIKKVFIAYGVPQPLPLQWQIINETEIDLSNLSFTLNLTRASAVCTIEGFEVIPPIDPSDSDPTQFKLERFLNLTNSYGEPPTEDMRLKITIDGGYNSTHTVTLIRPPTVPEPDIISPDGTSMVWLNQSVSSLKNLIFDIRYQGIVSWGGTDYRVIFDSNSTVSDFDFNQVAKQFSVTITGLEGTVGFCNISIPKDLLDAPPEDWIIIIDNPPALEYLTEYNVAETATHTFIYFTYDHSTHTLTVEGVTVIQEFNVIMLPLILMMLTLIVAAFAIKQRKRLGTLKTKYQNAICMFTSKPH